MMYVISTNVFIALRWCSRNDYRFAYEYKEQKIFSTKQKGFRDGQSYSTPQRSEETRGNAITQPRSHPIKRNVEFRDGMGPRLGNGISPCFFTFLRGGL